MLFPLIITQHQLLTTEPPWPTNLRALNIGVSKTNEDGKSSGFINEYFVYEIFCQ